VEMVQGELLKVRLRGVHFRSDMWTLAYTAEKSAMTRGHRWEGRWKGGRDDKQNLLLRYSSPEDVQYITQAGRKQQQGQCCSLTVCHCTALIQINAPLFSKWINNDNYDQLVVFVTSSFIART
jgi:hypothetical protein